MNKVHKVRTTKVRQTSPGIKTVKPGKAYNGANFVGQRESSAKKNARKSTAARRQGAA